MKTIYRYSVCAVVGLLMSGCALKEPAVVADTLYFGGPIVTANDGNEALAVLDDPAQAVGALITDINMGSTPDGWAVARHARQRQPDLPVV